jgi:alpha-tubulin suppressor-like RCC1 family protein
MPNPTTNFRDDYGTDLGNKLITKEYLMSVYPQIAANIITPELWVWGLNDNGELGTNNTTNKSTPVTTSTGGANWKQVTATYQNSAAIKTDGTLWTWGLNAYGELGINSAGTATGRTTPVTTFTGGTNWKQVSCGGFVYSYNMAAIKTDGTLWVWGFNAYGELGINNTLTKCTPVTTFAGGTNWKQVSATVNHMAAIKTDGTLWTWGYNANGQLGDNTTTQRNTPVTTFAGGNNWKQVSCGTFHTAAIKTDGTLWTWGLNSFGQLGINNTTFGVYILTPVTTFAGGTNWKSVAGGFYNTIAIKTDGTLWTWGDNNYGQLGINATNPRSIPSTTFAGGTNWKQVSGGYNHIAAIKTDGTLWTWGRNFYGQLGDNTTINRLTPVTTTAGGTNWKSVATGYTTLAIQSTDTL